MKDVLIVNDAVYIGKQRSDGKWSAMEQQFAQLYIFKILRESIELKTCVKQNP